VLSITDADGLIVSDTTRSPSGENATDVTPSSCPFSAAVSSPVFAFQMRIVLFLAYFEFGNARKQLNRTLRSRVHV
jgi:hypothetical protein